MCIIVQRQIREISVLGMTLLLRWVSGPGSSTERITLVFKIYRYTRFFTGQKLRDGPWFGARILASVGDYATTQRVAPVDRFLCIEFNDLLKCVSLLILLRIFKVGALDRSLLEC